MKNDRGPLRQVLPPLMFLMLAVVKLLCDRIDPLGPIATFLGH